MVLVSSSTAYTCPLTARLQTKPISQHPPAFIFIYHSSVAAADVFEWLIRWASQKESATNPPSSNQLQVLQRKMKSQTVNSKEFMAFPIASPFGLQLISYLCQGRCAFICLCLFISRITQKLQVGFPRNLVEWWFVTEDAIGADSDQEFLICIYIFFTFFNIAIIIDLFVKN